MKTVVAIIGVSFFCIGVMAVCKLGKRIYGLKLKNRRDGFIVRGEPWAHIQQFHSYDPTVHICSWTENDVNSHTITSSLKKKINSRNEVRVRTEINNLLGHLFFLLLNTFNS